MDIKNYIVVSSFDMMGESKISVYTREPHESLEDVLIAFAEIGHEVLCTVELEDLLLTALSADAEPSALTNRQYIQ